MGRPFQYHVHVGHCKRRAPSYGISDLRKTPITPFIVDLLSLSRCQERYENLVRRAYYGSVQSDL